MDKKVKYDVIALDLDGTLTNNKKVITEKTLQYVQKAMNSGAKIVLASGRPVLGIKPLADQLNFQKMGGYILAYNGAEIIDCTTGSKIFKRELPFEYYTLICETARRFHVHALTYDEEGILAESDSARYVIQEGVNNSIPIKKVDKLENAVKNPVPKFMIVGEPELIKEVQEYLLEQVGDKISIFLSEPYFLEITAKNIKKDSSLEYLLSYLNIGRERLVAIGDGLNDLPMFNVAGLSIAMENACIELKNCADVITGSNENDGVAEAIEKYILCDEKGRTEC